MTRALSLFILMLFCSSCTWWQAFNITKEVVQHYPQDNFLEEIVEEHIEDHFGLEDGSIDLSPFSPEDDMTIIFSD